MKLISFKRGGQESWGAVVNGDAYDLAQVTGLQTMAEFLGSERFGQGSDLLKGQSPIGKFDDLELLPVIPRPEKIVCAVRNYMDHHHEAISAGLKVELSQEPPIFLRVWRSQCAHKAPIIRPRVSESLDWEGELAVVIGKRGRNIPESEALKHVAGYSCYNDGSIREWQFHQ